jgi:glycosyltransferase involved in cell wall biosynthesis
MRIVTVLTSLGVGGAEKLALAVAERMARRGHAVMIVVLRERLAEEWPTALPTVYLDLRKSPLSALPALLRARRALAGFRPDLIHSHSFHANIFSRLLGWLAPRIAVLSTIHNVYEGGWMRMSIYRLTDRLSRRSVAVSEAAAERFVQLRAVPARKCLVIPNGIDLDEFVSDAGRRAQTRVRMKAGSSFVWLTAGRIAPAKDYPNLLRALAKVIGQFGNTQLWIAGEAAAGAVEPLQALTRELGVEASVQWLGLRRDLPALLDAADGFVLGSAWEGMPLVLGEAMAMEKPVAATDVGGVRELAGDVGSVVPAKNPDALAGAMRAIMQRSAEERAAQGRAARERIEQQFSVEASANRWAQLYGELIAQ